MAFGRELQDFVSGFQTGYNLIKSPEEKEWEREKRRMAKEEFERTGRWGEEDRDYRDRRAARSDFETDRAYDYGVRQDGMRFEWDVQKWGDEQAEKKLNRAQEMGPDLKAIEDMDKYTDGIQNSKQPSESAIPDDEVSSLVEPAAYNNPEEAAATAAESAIQNLDNGWLIYDNANATRNKPLSEKLEASLGTVANELGLKVKVFSGGQSGSRRTGSPRHNDGDAADVFFYDKNGRKLDWANPKDRPIFEEIVKRGKQAGLTGFGAGPGYMQAGSMHVGFGDPAVWGSGGKSANAADWLKTAYGMSRGGSVSAIPDDDEEENPMAGLFTVSVDGDQPAPQEVAQVAIPEEGPVPTPRPQYEGTSEGNDDPPTDDPWELGRRAVRDGLKRAVQETGADGDSALADPELEKMRQNYIRGYGAAPQQLMRQVIDKIDPNREMPPAERNMKAMGTVYQFYMDRGEPEKAQQAALSMVQFYRRASQQFLALGQAAAAQGDIDAAAKAAVAAYANIPNGRDMQINKVDDGYEISVTDSKTGKPVTRKVVSPQEFAAAAMNFNPTTFDDEIMNAAGAPAEEFKDASLEDVRATDEEISALAEEMFTEQGYNPNQIAAIRDAAGSIAKTQKNQMGPEEALRFASDLMAFNADDPTDDSAGFSSKPVRGNPNRVEVTLNGKTAVMTKGQFNALTGARASLETERKTAREEEAKSEAASQERMDWLWKGVDAFKGAVGDEVERFKQSYNNAQRTMDRRARERGQQGPAMPEGVAAQQGVTAAIAEAEQALADGYSPGYVAAMLQEAGVPEEQWPQAVREAANSPAGVLPVPAN